VREDIHYFEILTFIRIGSTEILSMGGFEFSKEPENLPPRR
jgi:hypothetical protein